MTMEDLKCKLHSNFTGEFNQELSSPLINELEQPPAFVTPIACRQSYELPANCLADEKTMEHFTFICQESNEQDLPVPFNFDCRFEVPDDVLAMLPSADKAVPLVPDISSGLGHRRDVFERKQLEQFATEQMKLRVYGGDLCEFRAPCWKRLDSRTCTIRLKETFRLHGLDTHLGSSDYQELYRALCTNPELQGGEMPEPPLHCLNLRDMTYDIQHNRFYPHDPNDGFFFALDLTSHDLMDPGDGQIFENFIFSVSGGDPKVRQQVLELVALACTGYPIKAFFVLVGPSGTGKSQMGRFLVELLGHENAAAIGGVHELGSRFALAGMENIRLAACLDLPDTALPAAAIGTLKTAVSDDAKKVEAKYKNPRTIYHGPLWLFASNHPLRVQNLDQEDAFLSRMVLIPFLHAVPPEQQIPQLYRRLLDEAPYIVSQSISAYRQLMANHFSPTQTVVPPEYSPGEASDGLAAVRKFLQNFCIQDSKGSVSTESLFRAYSQAAAEAHWPILSKIAFARILSGVLTSWNGVTVAKRTGEDELRGYQGLRLVSSVKGGDSGESY